MQPLSRDQLTVDELMNQLSLTLFGNAGPRSCLLHRYEMKPHVRHRRGPEQALAYRWVCTKCDYARRKRNGQTAKDYAPLARKRERSKEYRLSTSKREHYKRKYGISLDELYRLWEKQSKACCICERGLPNPVEGRIKHRSGTFHLDHCHDSGRLRGLLCNRCNMAIGLFDDSRDRLLSAAEYLRRHAMDSAA